MIAGAATFAAFPAWYATMFSGFYVALLLLLVFLITRIVSFEWRGKADSGTWRGFWTWVNAIASLAIPLDLGHRALQPPARRPGLVGAGVHRHLLGSLHAVHGRCRRRPRRCSSRSTARSTSACARTATCEPAPERGRRGSPFPAALVGAAFLVWTLVVGKGQERQGPLPGHRRRRPGRGRRGRRRRARPPAAERSRVRRDRRDDRPRRRDAVHRAVSARHGLVDRASPTASPRRTRRPATTRSS